MSGYRLNKNGEIILLATPFALIGRSNKCDICIDLAGVSNFHARLHKSVEGWIIDDIDSKNGTFVNDVRIQQSTHVNPGDELRFNGSDAYLLEADPECTLPDFRLPHEGTKATSGAIESKLDATVAALGRLATKMERFEDELSEARIERRNTSRKLVATTTQLGQLNNAISAHGKYEREASRRLTRQIKGGLATVFATVTIVAIGAYATLSAEDKKGPIHDFVDFAGGAGEAVTFVVAVVGSCATAASWLANRVAARDPKELEVKTPGNSGAIDGDS